MCMVEVSPAKIEVFAARTSEIPSVKYPAPALAAACIVPSEREQGSDYTARSSCQLISCTLILERTKGAKIESAEKSKQIANMNF